MSDTSHVVLIHGSWSRGKEWAPARAAFEQRGFTVHTPTLRHHELPLHQGAMEIARLSLRDYADDLVAFVETLDSPPLLVGHSMGGLLVQLVAARTRHVGMVAACPGAAGPSGANATTLGIALGGLQSPRPWTKAVYPPTWQRFWRGVAGAQSEADARAVHDELVCESGRVVFFELGLPWLDRAKAARVDAAAVTGPILVIAGEHDRIVPPRVARQTAARYPTSSYVEIPGSDHLVFAGRTLPITMARIDDWIVSNQLRSPAPD